MRIIKIYAHIRIMKARVNLTIEQDILEKAKNYAAKIGASVSELVEDYLKKIITEQKEPKEIKTKLFEMVENLPKVEYPENYDFKEEFYKEKMKKYGF